MISLRERVERYAAAKNMTYWDALSLIALIVQALAGAGLIIAMAVIKIIGGGYFDRCASR